MRVLLIFLFLLLWAPGPLQAHGVKLLALAEGGQLSGRGYFVGGGPAMNCPLSLRDEQDQEIARAQTDAQGKFNFSLPLDLQGTYRLLLLAGPGHQAETLLRLGGADTSDTPVPPAAAGTEPEPGQSLAQISRQLAGLQEQVLNLQLALEQGETITWEKIMAGLGYILGLLGLATYCRCRPFVKRDPPKSSSAERQKPSC
jgi:nickel transport protein